VFVAKNRDILKVNYMYLIFIELRKKIVFTFSFVGCYLIAKQLYINAEFGVALDWHSGTTVTSRFTITSGVGSARHIREQLSCSMKRHCKPTRKTPRANSSQYPAISA
tara:strand:- start:1065 stop:1388 length:324 start_codon:yes stop_codon:yes gene_type:complete